MGRCQGGRNHKFGSSYVRAQGEGEPKGERGEGASGS